MSANALLLWMSARGEGSWEQFRAAVEELHLGDNGEISPDSSADDIAEEAGLPLYHLLRLNLQRLGHAEFHAGAGGSDWKTAPPCMAITERRDGWLGVVAGARSPALLERLRGQEGHARAASEPCSSAPDVIRLLASEPAVLVASATSAGIHVQQDAATAILLSLPVIGDRSVWRRSDIPVGTEWRIERFLPEALGWRPALRTEAQECELGLFRFTLRYRRHVLLCSRSRGTFEVPVQVGKYLVVRRRRRRLWRYDGGERRLTVPAICRPPFLVERALLACSGFLPSYERQEGIGGLLHYADVPRSVAQLASAVLAQELR